MSSMEKGYQASIQSVAGHGIAPAVQDVTKTNVYSTTSQDFLKASQEIPAPHDDKKEFATMRLNLISSKGHCATSKNKQQVGAMLGAVSGAVMTVRTNG